MEKTPRGAPEEPKSTVDGSGRRSRRVPSTRKKLGTVVRERLLGEIRAGRWRAGDRLPTEPQMVVLFGVSRTPIREAMQSLNLLGVVDISPRRGATVRALGIESVVDLAILSGSMAPLRSVADMFAFRYAMEGAIAELAASNASNPQIQALRSLLAENMAAVRRGDREEAQKIDVLFHEAIAGASANVVFQSVAQALNGLQVELRRVIAGIPGASQAALAEHSEIFAAIARHDLLAARRAAESHIQRTRFRYESAHSQPDDPPPQRAAT